MAIDFRNTDTKTTAISGYKPFWLQKATGAAVDTRVQWGMVAKTNPYPILPTPKEPYANDWLDEDGLDEYNVEMHYEPVEFSVAFYVKAYASGNQTAASVLRGWLLNFFDWVRNGEFRTYDSYTDVGYRKVRLDGYEEDKFKARDTWASAVVKVKFKANDPTTRMYYLNSEIVPANYGTSGTASATANKSVSLSTSGFSLSEGVAVGVKFSNANTAASVNLNVANTGNRPVIHVPAGSFKAGTQYLFVYDGSNWDCKGTL